MKLQLTSLVTLAILYGSVTATPIPVDDQVPSAGSAVLSGIGHGLSDIFQFLAPTDAFNGAVNAAGACIVRNNQLICPQQRRDVESEEQVPSLGSAVLGGVGHGLSDLFQFFAPTDALNGAVNAAGACLVRNGQLICPQQRRDEESEEQVPSLGSAVLGGVGHGLSDLFQFFAPTETLNGAVNAAGACLVRNGQLICPQQRREEESEEQVPSAGSAILGGIGHGLSDIFQFLAPTDAFNGAVNAAGACIVRNNQLICPQQRRDEESEEQVPSLGSAVLGGVGHGLSDLFQFFAPTDALNGAVNAAGACLVRNGQLICPQQRREEESEEQVPSAGSAILGGIGHGLSDIFQFLAPTDALNGAVNAAGACLVRNGQLICPQQRRDEEQVPSAGSAVLSGIGHGLSDIFQFLAPTDALNGAVNAAGACLVRNGQLICPQQRRDEESEEQVPSAGSAVLSGIGHGLSDIFQFLAPTDTLDGGVMAAGACLVRNNQLICPRS